MVSIHSSKEMSNSAIVRKFERRWKKLAHDAQQERISHAQYLNFELPFTQRILEELMSIPDIRTTVSPFLGMSFSLLRTGLPTLILSVEGSRIFQVKPADGTSPSTPGIEFADADLYIEGILGLSSRKEFLMAYVGGEISAHGLHKLRTWTPYILAKLLKVDRNVYQRIVCNSIRSTGIPPTERVLED